MLTLSAQHKGIRQVFESGLEMDVTETNRNAFQLDKVFVLRIILEWSVQSNFRFFKTANAIFMQN